MTGEETVVFLEGKRVKLCPLRDEDVAQYQRWFNDQEVIQYMLSYAPMTLQHERDFIENVQQSSLEKQMIVAIRLKDSDELIGNLGYHGIDHRQQRAEVGIVIGEKRFWNKGYGTEAMRLWLEYGFNMLNFRKVILEVFEQNLRAQAAYKKLGFCEVGRLREHRLINGEWKDNILMELFRRDYFSE